MHSDKAQFQEAHMKRRIFSALLVCALLATIMPFPAAADSSGLCYTSTDDKLLNLSNAAYSYGGSLYVPAQAYSAYGISFSYFSESRTGLLSNGKIQVFFDLIADTSYDPNGNYFNASGTFHNGQLYVPVGWTSHYFGLSYSYIPGNGCGDIVRIKSGSEVLTDARFLEAATYLMKSYYNDYFHTNTTPTPTPTPTPAVIPSEESGKAGTVTLCFVGLPDKELLDQLAAHSYKGCFFLTADEANASPDLVRRIYGSGFGLGICCKSNAGTECQAAADAIFAAVQVRPTLLTSPPAISKACADYAATHGYAYYAQRNSFSAANAKASAISSLLENANSRVIVTLTCGTGTAKLISGLAPYIASKNISVLPLLETGA